VQFIRTRDVLQMLGVSRTTLWRMVRAGTFPRRVTISARASGHVLEEVEAWMAERADRSPARATVPVPQLAPGSDELGLGTSDQGGAPVPAVGSAGSSHQRRRGRGQG
jgi:prophage regulatory protein